MTPASLAREFQVNCFAPMLLTQAFARVLEGRPGCVVNLLDRRVAGVEAGCIPYLVSKQALAAFTRNAALELAPGVRVNGVAPGPILSPPGEADDVVRELAGRTPLTYRCSPADIAAAVGFLVEQDGITGQILFVDSGQHLNPEHRRT
jgi:NAD(P)-dependent dehydrogenase (short-subunit alcohol dehydrogenase family)